jgi:hypothetical protein
MHRSQRPHLPSTRTLVSFESRASVAEPYDASCIYYQFRDVPIHAGATLVPNLIHGGRERRLHFRLSHGIDQN